MADPLSLSRRERQILEIIYRLGSATAADVERLLTDPPTYTTIRGLLRVLESKGHVRHEEQGNHYVYFPSLNKSRAGKSVLSHVVRTFFDGSPARAMAALLGADRSLSEEELDRLADLVDAARQKGRS